MGTRYDDALREMYNGYGTGNHWTVTDKMRTGDLVLSIVATAPRMIIGLDEVLVDYDPYTSAMMECDTSKAIVFKNGILAKAVANRCKWASLPEEGYLVGNDARALLKALDDEYQQNIPWFTPDRWREL